MADITNQWQLRGTCTFVQTGEGKDKTPISRVGIAQKHGNRTVHASFAVFGKYAQLVAANVEKGRTVQASGHINSVMRTDESGREHHGLDLVANSVIW